MTHRLRLRQPHFEPIDPWGGRPTRVRGRALKEAFVHREVGVRQRDASCTVAVPVHCLHHSRVSQRLRIAPDWPCLKEGGPTRQGDAEQGDAEQGDAEQGDAGQTEVC